MIAFENAQTVTSFDFYDKKNKNRMSMVKDTINNQCGNLKIVAANLSELKE